MLNLPSRVIILIVLWPLCVSVAAGQSPRKSVESINSLLQSDDVDQQTNGLSQLHVVHDGLIDCLPALIRLARRSKLEQRLVALKIISQYAHHARNAGPQLRGLLDDPEISIRGAAAHAILSIEGESPAAVGVLTGLLRADDPEQRLRAIESLAQHSLVSRDALPELIAATKDEDVDVRAAAAGAIGEIAMFSRHVRLGGEALAALRMLLDDSEPKVRGSAARALWNLDEPASAVLPTLTKLVSDYRPEPMRDVIQDIGGHDEALKLIQEIGPEAESAIPALIAALDSPQLGERMAAADALGAIGTAALPAIERLSKSLRETKPHSFPFAHQAWFVSDQAADALGKIGPAAYPTLRTALTDDDKRVRQLAALQLTALAPDEATIAALRRMLDDEDASTRAQACWLLQKMGPKGIAAAPRIAGFLNEQTNWLSFPGRGMGGRYELEYHALGALRAIQPKAEELLPIIAQVLRKDRRIGWELSEYLGDLGTSAKPLVPDVEPLLKEPKQRMVALMALTHIAPDHPHLVEQLQEELRDSSHAVSAAWGLGNLGTRARAALPALRRLLAEDKHLIDSRLLVVAAIVKIDPADVAAIRSLSVLLQDLAPRHLMTQDLRDARSVWQKLGTKAAVAEGELVAGLRYIDSESEDDPYFRNVREKERRLQAALMLLELKTMPKEVLATLQEICRCDHPQLRAEAADAWGRTDSEAASAPPLLAKLLADEATYVAEGNGYGRDGIDHRVADHAQDALATLGAIALPALREASESRSRGVRRRAIEALGEMKPAGPISSDQIPQILITALQDSAREVRRAAAVALGQLPTAQDGTITALTKALVDKDLLVRIHAAQSLGRFGAKSTSAVPALDTLRKDPYTAVREAATKALAQIRPSGS